LSGHAYRQQIAVPSPSSSAPGERRGRQRDPIRQAVKTVPGGTDRHVHCVIFEGDDGDGFTTPGVDGHVHQVEGLELVAAGGHTHDLSATRCDASHDRVTGKHVQARR